MMAMFADIVLEPGGIIASLIVGLLAGFLASRVMGSGGYGLIGDIVVGWSAPSSEESCAGGSLSSASTAWSAASWSPFVGACLLIWIVRMISPTQTAL